MPTIGPRWDALACDDPATERLAAALDVPPIVARLLCQRGLSDPEQASRFLNPSLDHLHDPMGLADMSVAVDRIMAAIARKERIAIHGDYDVDGITSTVILRRALELLGADVTHFIPERLKDGYGLQPAAIERLHADGVALVVSVDCGIRGADAALRARELGVDLIITDHHEPDSELPLALAVINPKRHDCSYPDKNLAGVGVALKLVQALCRKAGRDNWLPGFIKVAAIGTLADVVPLVGENRVIAKIGLELLTKGPHKVGLRALLDVSGLDRQDHRQLSHRLHARATGQRRGAHEHAGYRHPASPRARRGDGGRGACNWRCNSTARTSSARKKRPRFWPPPRRSCRPTPRSARARFSWWPAKAGIEASSASWRQSSSTPFTGRRSSCRLTATSRTAHVAASHASTCWPRSSAAHGC